MHRSLIFLCLEFCFALAGFPLSAQPATPTSGALFTTMMLQYGNERGTIFSLDVDGREYWFTAKHIFTGIKSGPAGAFPAREVQVKILSPDATKEEWLPETFTVIDPGTDIDIVVLTAERTILPAHSQLKPGDAGITLGADCEFLGFPYGGGWKAEFASENNKEGNKSYWVPYMKRCSVSAMLKDATTIWVLDGINNEGFSGGPVLFNTGDNQKIFAVISGYHTEPSEVLPLSARIPSPDSDKANSGTTNEPNKKEDKRIKAEKQFVNLNSGFIIAYDIQAAITAIRKNPIGPLRAQ